jgi:hypothetical protein
LLATYKDFLGQNPICKKFKNDDDMREIFDLLSRSNILIQLIEASDAGKPALTPVAANIEHIFMNVNKTHENTLDDNFTKQAVGLMVKTVLKPFGYLVCKQKDLPKSSGAIKFQSASTYRFDMSAPRTMRLIKRIEEII